VANQIAAGEVIQRPASAVKELMENAIDAGSSNIKLIIKEGGSALIQVMDDGCGMSETDARLSFERHATSKIRKAEDLFSIRTMGFRGEALASIAAIAQVELKTKRVEDEVGTCIIIEGSEVKSQEASSCNNGTSFSIKNLFYNVPARRNFLKSVQVETKHIIDEFQRVALAHSEVAFSFYNNQQEIFHLKQGPLSHRIVGIFGDNYKERLVPVDETTSILKINGFVCKPEFAKKTRGEQFFFINKRFIKDAYLNHAVIKAFEELLPEDSFPSYFLYIDIDPSHIDINIHPTKTEIKFDDDKSVYAIVKAAVKRALAQYQIVPVLDFDQERAFNIPFHKLTEIPTAPTITINKDYNPFKQSETKERNSFNSQKIREESNQKNWTKLFETPELPLKNSTHVVISSVADKKSDEELTEKVIFQLHNRFILTQVKSGLMIVDQQSAHERILFEKYTNWLQNNKGYSQQQLFPQTIEFSAPDFQLVNELLSDIKNLGFDIREFGKNTFVIDGVPVDVKQGEELKVIEGIIEQYKLNSVLKLDKRENLARSMAKNTCIKSGRSLNVIEMRALIDELFACENPSVSPSGNATISIIPLEELGRKFDK